MAHTFKALRDDEKQAIEDAILEKKDAVAEYRTNYESTLNAKNAQGRMSYQAGHNEARFVRKDNLLEILMSALFASSTIYMFSEMYVVAMKPRVKIVDNNGILNRFYDGEMRLDPDESISAIEVHKFLSDNEVLMKKEKVIDSPEGLQTWSGSLPHGDMEFLRKSTAILRRFDNSLGVGITYGLTVNETEKVVAVTFRGSVTGTDWWKNINFFWETLHDNVKVHKGFYDYLYRHGTSRKINDIVRDIKDVFKDEELKKTYELYIFGHSLGGALAQLLAYEIQRKGVMRYLEMPDAVPEGKVFGPLREGSTKKPNVVTFGSPYVGNRDFQRAFDEMCPHIRVTNEGDIVPTLPPSLTGGYVHTGMNIHCRYNAPPKLQSFDGHLLPESQGTTSSSSSFWSQLFTLKPSSSHNLLVYWRNLCYVSLAELKVRNSLPQFS